jgi:type II secretory pathway pseudopilin PulG
MRKAARSLKTRGITLVELIIVGGIIAVLLAITTPYLFGTREKTLLEKERDKVVDFLKIAQQNAIAAKGGHEYRVMFQLAQNTFTLVPPVKPAPVTTGSNTLEIHPDITITSPHFTTYIAFLRLTGLPQTTEPNDPLPLDLTLESRHFQCKVQVSWEGVITSTKPERI